MSHDTVLIAIGDDDEPFTPSACAWYLVAPCGCRIAVTSATRPDGVMVHDPERAWRDLSMLDQPYGQARQQGYRVELDRLARAAEIGCVHVLEAIS